MSKFPDKYEIPLSEYQTSYADRIKYKKIAVWCVAWDKDKTFPYRFRLEVEFHPDTSEYDATVIAAEQAIEEYSKKFKMKEDSFDMYIDFYNCDVLE